MNIKETGKSVPIHECTTTLEKAINVTAFVFRFIDKVKAKVKESREWERKYGKRRRRSLRYATVAVRNEAGKKGDSTYIVGERRCGSISAAERTGKIFWERNNGHPKEEKFAREK